MKYGEGSEIWVGREVAYVPNLSSWEVHNFSANTCYSPKGVPPSVRFGMVVLIKGIEKSHQQFIIALPCLIKPSVHVNSNGTAILSF